MSEFVDTFFDQVAGTAQAVDRVSVGRLVAGLRSIRETGGRLFVLGVGGSAGNASHSVNDFRKLCGIEAYAPTDNVSELTARTNDEGWESVFSEWLRISRLGDKDGLLIFSVGGGDRERNLSVNLIRAIDLAREVGAKVYGIVGRDSGYTAQMADAVVVVPGPDPQLLTPMSEAFQAVVWHCLVSHPDLQTKATTW